MALIKRFYAGKADCLVYDTREAMGIAAGQLAGRLIVEMQKTRDDITLMLSAAPSQQAMLDELFANACIDWRKITVFHVDEKLTQAADNPLSSQSRIRKMISRLPYKQAFFFDGVAPDPEAECQRYGELIKQHPIDIVFLGIGDDGHLAFCEPGWARFDDPNLCGVCPLDDSTKMQNVRGGSYKSIEDVPSHGYTVTLTGLMTARYKIISSPFTTKADACYHVLFDSISEKYPASVMRLWDNVYSFHNRDSAAKFPNIDWSAEKGE